MKMSRLIALLALVLTLLCSNAAADSLIPGVSLQASTASDDWQILYLACYTADGMTRSGYIQNNWTKLKAVCNGVEFPTELSYELVSADENEETLTLRINCDFDDKAVISITSEPIPEEECLAHFHTSSNLVFSEDMITFILMDEDARPSFGKSSSFGAATFYWLSVDEFMQSYGELYTVKAEITLSSPYVRIKDQPEGLSDVNILLYCPN